MKSKCLRFVAFQFCCLFHQWLWIWLLVRAAERGNAKKATKKEPLTEKDLAGSRPALKICNLCWLHNGFRLHVRTVETNIARMRTF